MRFADPLDGWAFGPELWSTHDGGVSWHESSIGGVWSLEAADGHVSAMARDQDTASVNIETSPTTSDSWVEEHSLDFGAGPVPMSDLVLQGSTGWAIEDDREPVGAARLVSGHWTAWPAPCSNNGGDSVVAAATASSLVAVCEEGVWGPSGYSGPPAVRAYFSGNGGATFRLGGIVPGDASSSGNLAASPTPGVVVTDNFVGTENNLLETFNGGASWQVVASTPDTEPFSYVGFTSSAQGVAIEAGETTSHMLMTFDGGRSWSPVSF